MFSALGGVSPALAKRTAGDTKARMARECSSPAFVFGCRSPGVGKAHGGGQTDGGGVWGPNPSHDASQYPNGAEGIGRRHKKGAVVTGFSDHVQFITFEQFQREQRQNKPGLLWRVPDTLTGE